MIQYNSPKEFAKNISKGYWQSAKHLDLINKLLIKLNNRNIYKLIINLPPRHGKSEFISKYFIAWYMLKNPGHKVMLIAYSDSLAKTLARGVQDVIREAIEGSDITIDPKMKAAGNFRLLPDMTSLFACGAGGSITGKGADLMIIDDPIKNIAEAMSMTKRDSLWEWFLSTAYTRLEPNGVVAIVMTRWHSDDLVGRIENKFEVINYEEME
jgi:hypothetical protein